MPECAITSSKNLNLNFKRPNAAIFINQIYTYQPMYSPITSNITYQIHTKKVSKFLLSLEIAISLIYLYCIVFLLDKGEPVLFWILSFSEVFHVWLLITLIYTIWPREINRKVSKSFQPAIDIFITVVNEPVEIVYETIKACQNMKYPSKNIYILNDGLVAKNDEWEQYEDLAKSEGIRCITRRKPGGAKAGNINHALNLTNSDFVAVFDADHAPYSDFLQKMTPYFVDSNVGFVQSPQYYKNFVNNTVTLGAAEQQELFFGPIMSGKDKTNSAFMCGTNMIIRRSTLDQVGGLSEQNIAEDFMTSLLIHKRGWKSVYVPEVLAEGLAPEDFLSYYKQQFRWARGSMEILFWHNPIFSRSLTFAQKLNYFISASYYLSGVAVVANMITPLIFLFTGLEPLRSSTMILPAIFLPYIIFGIMVLNFSTNSSYTFKALAFSNGCFWIFCKALFSVIFKQKNSFDVTSKSKLSGNFVMLVWPHILYIVVGVIASIYGLQRVGLNPAVLTNICWFIFNMCTFFPFIVAALPEISLANSFQKKPTPLQINN
jgi:cellulose synthase (UDP-forming)